jgi:hypothetical protein
MTKQKQKLKSNEAIVVPKQYAGQWIVWGRQRTKILGSGENRKELKAAALASGEDEPAYEWVPRGEASNHRCRRGASAKRGLLMLKCHVGEHLFAISTMLVCKKILPE